VVTEALLPVLLASDENRNTVDEGAACLQDLLDIPLGGHFRADREVADNDIGLRVLEDLDDVDRWPGRLGDDLG
jgi:hypothetical protein